MATFTEQIQAVKDHVRAQVFRAELLEGAPVSEEQVLRETNASVRAVRRALTDLAQEGLLYRKQRAGTFVSKTAARAAGGAPTQVKAVGLWSGFNKKDFDNTPFISAIRRGIEDTLKPPKKINYFLNPSPITAAPYETPPIDSSEVKNGLQGLIAIEATNLSQLNEAARMGLPVVSIDYGPTEMSFDAVIGDHQEAGILATNSLLQLGHREIAFMGEPPTAKRCDPAWQDRFKGFLYAMLCAGLPARPERILHVLRSAVEPEKALPEFHRAQQPTAYVLCSGSLYETCLKTLAGMGLSCPRDLSLVACDGSGRQGKLPEMSFAGIDNERLGQTAVRLLAARLSCRSMPPARVVVPAEFSIGASSGPPRRK